jgi:hypothetical protein
VGTMDGPDDDFRAFVAGRAAELGEDDEEGLVELLSAIDVRLAEDVDPDAIEGAISSDLLSSVNAWAGLASYAVAHFYAPSSPWPSRRLAGWSKRAMAYLQRIVSKLVPAIRSAVSKLSASGYGITINFPWGIGITVNF